MEPINLKFKMADPSQVDDAIKRALGGSIWIDTLPPVGVEELVSDIHQAWLSDPQRLTHQQPSLLSRQNNVS